MELADLVAIEEIKQLKARYFRFMDQGDWEAFRELFAEDAEQSWTPSPGEAPVGSRGRDAVVDHVRASLSGMRSTHHGHMPEIEITGPDSATGIWSLFDYCTKGDLVVMNGTGWYRDTYVKRDERWLIRSTHVTTEPLL